MVKISFFYAGLLLIIFNVLFNIYHLRYHSESMVGNIDEEILRITSSERAFCDKYKQQPHLLEEKCKDFPINICKNMNCCVLLNDRNCVSGNSNGPIYTTNDDGSRINVNNYYYENKCYGDKCQ
jgi:hypothetical protein